jgi:Protein of unknown function (DUF2845)
MKRWLLGVVLMSIAGAAGAQAMECGNRLITRGDTSSEVIARCGNPTHVEHSTLTRSASGAWVNGQWVQSGGAQVDIAVEVWLYNLGPDKLMRQIRFEDGRVVKIETLDYGFIDGSW